MWLMYTKALRFNVLDKGQFVNCKVFGSFSLIKNIDSTQTTNRVCFVPSSESLE